MTQASAGCELSFNVVAPAEIVLQVAVARRPGVAVSENLAVSLDGRPVEVLEVEGPHGNRMHVISCGAGRLLVAYNARAGVQAWAQPVTPLARVEALRPSRYCPADQLAGFALAQFGSADPREPSVAAAVVANVVSFVHSRIRYRAGASDTSTDAASTLLTSAGVCRDFAHLVAALLRALDIPARIAAVYAPGLSPMDFHAVVEAAVGGVWTVVDATRLAPRPSLLRISTGPDAASTPFATVQAGRAELTGLTVHASTDTDLPVDDHIRHCHLA